ADEGGAPQKVEEISTAHRHSLTTCAGGDNEVRALSLTHRLDDLDERRHRRVERDREDDRRRALRRGHATTVTTTTSARSQSARHRHQRGIKIRASQIDLGAHLDDLRVRNPKVAIGVDGVARKEAEDALE